jgi:hypothetical protein
MKINSAISTEVSKFRPTNDTRFNFFIWPVIVSTNYFLALTNRARDVAMDFARNEQIRSRRQLRVHESRSRRHRQPVLRIGLS